MSLTTITIATAPVELCAICGCDCKQIMRGRFARPQVAATTAHSALHVARIEEWLAKTPSMATFCWLCARRHLPSSAIARADQRVHNAAIVMLFYAAFGHPTLLGREDWRPARRSPLAPAAADAAAVLYGTLPGAFPSDRGPQPLYPRRRDTVRGWRRWLKVRKRARRRARRRSRRMGALAAISWLFARAEHGQGGLVRAEARMRAR